MPIQGPATEATARAWVRSVLTSRLGIPEDVLIESPSGFCFRLVSSMMCVLIHADASGRPFVKLQGLAAEQVPVTHALSLYVATEGGNWMYGHLNLVPDDEGTTCSLVFRHNVAFCHLTEEIFDEVFRKFAGTLEEMDDQLVAMFGGHRKFEDV